MKIQRVTKLDGVKGKYVPGRERRRSSGPAAPGDTALVAPAPLCNIPTEDPIRCLTQTNAVPGSVQTRYPIKPNRELDFVHVHTETGPK